MGGLSITNTAAICAKGMMMQPITVKLTALQIQAIEQAVTFGHAKNRSHAISLALFHWFQTMKLKPEHVDKMRMANYARRRRPDPERKSSE